jgi:hypothetical protein
MGAEMMPMAESTSYCLDRDHNYQQVAGRSPYYKRDGGTGALGLPTFDQTVAWVMLTCTKCGKQLEVIARDYRKAEGSDVNNTNTKA